MVVMDARINFAEKKTKKKKNKQTKKKTKEKKAFYRLQNSRYFCADNPTNTYLVISDLEEKTLFHSRFF